MSVAEDDDDTAWGMGGAAWGGRAEGGAAFLTMRGATYELPDDTELIEPEEFLCRSMGRGGAGRSCSAAVATGDARYAEGDVLDDREPCDDDWVMEVGVVG